jgi:hypothetical protein
MHGTLCKCELCATYVFLALNGVSNSNRSTISNLPISNESFEIRRDRKKTEPKTVAAFDLLAAGKKVP